MISLSKLQGRLPIPIQQNTVATTLYRVTMMQSRAQMNPAALASAVLRFRKVRRDVWSDGTRRPTSTQEEHLGNKQKLRTTLTTLSERASLSNWSGGGEAVAHRLWREMWTKIRYAGFRAHLATREIESLSTEPGSFDQYRMRRYVPNSMLVIGRLRQ